MDFKKIISISGMPGLYQMVKSHKQGSLVRMLGEQRIQLVSNHYHFSLLDGISVYTQKEPLAMLPEVFSSMEQIEQEGTPPPAAKASDKELTDYFAIVLPNYNRRTVYISDIKKIVKWYKILKESNALPVPVAQEPSAELPSDEQELVQATDEQESVQAIDEQELADSLDKQEILTESSSEQKSDVE